MQSPAKPGKKPNLRERVYQMLRERIQMGLVGSSDRLVDHDIARELHVSRMPVREALMQLKNEGMLEGTARGFILRRHSLQQINDIFEIRILLEPHAAALATANVGPAFLARMKSALDAAQEASDRGDWETFMRLNADYRAAWIDNVPNRAMADAISRFIDHAQTVRLMTMQDETVRGIILDGMRGLYEAYLSGNADLVRERMTSHCRTAAVCYYQCYQRLSGGMPPLAH
ncbi:MAG TPA: GntR family transcriptional regulator [Bordetella sp.]|uniref:GntR family transcriptional regulator n=1 Tax=Bordetella sp. TaxID=28081 RepID=UPI002ED015D5